MRDRQGGKGQLRSGDLSNHFQTHSSHVFIPPHTSHYHFIHQLSNRRSIINPTIVLILHVSTYSDNDPNFTAADYLRKYKTATDNPSTATDATFFAISIKPLFIPSAIYN
jgi:hypothetical protein